MPSFKTRQPLVISIFLKHCECHHFKLSQYDQLIHSTLKKQIILITENYCMVRELNRRVNFTLIPPNHLPTNLRTNVVQKSHPQNKALVKHNCGNYCKNRECSSRGKNACGKRKVPEILISLKSFSQKKKKCFIKAKVFRTSNLFFMI